MHRKWWSPAPIQSIRAERAPLLGVAEAAGVANREEEEAA